MAYSFPSVVSDGTQVFGIPTSPVTINSVVYIAEDINFTRPTNRQVIKDDKGVPIGQTIVPDVDTGTAKLQLASVSTAVPPRGQTMILAGTTYYLTEVGEAYTQGAYAYVNVSFALKIN
jgi:hypothetical protein